LASLFHIAPTCGSDLGFYHPLDSTRSQTGGADIDLLGLSVDDHANAL